MSIGIEGIAETEGVSASIQDVSGGVMRTVHPALSGFTKYAVSFTPTAAGQVHEPVEAAGTSVAVDLVVGTYTITVTGYTGADTVAAEKTVQGVVVTVGNTTPARAVLTPKAGSGNGTFSYDVTVPAGLASGALTITTQDGGFVSGGTADLSQSGQKAGTLTLPAGSYLIKVELLKGNKIAGFSHEVVHIYAGLTSELPAKAYEDDDFSLLKTVDSFNLAALFAAPVKGATAATAITITAQYAGTIGWNPQVAGVFAAITTYTATVTLEARTGWTFEGVGANSFAYSGASSVTNPADSGVVTIVFPKTDPDYGTSSVDIDFNYAAIPVTRTPNVSVIAQGGASLTLSVAENAGYSDIKWYLAGQSSPAATGYSFVLDPSAFSPKNYTVTVTALKDGNLYSEMVEFTVTAAAEPESDFGFNSGAITSYKGNAALVVIPAAINGQPVTGIGASAFSNKQLIGVTIPDSVTSIGIEAFSGNQLTSVTIPGSVTSIGDQAFYNNQLTNVTIPNSVTSIGRSAFYNNQLTNVTIPNSVTSIGGSAFSNNQLTSVTIPGSVTSIGDGVFYRNQLSSATIPGSVTSIGNQAFWDNKLTSVTIPGSVTSIGDQAFQYNQLTSVSIGYGVTTIGGSAFSNNQLTSVTIPGSVIEIEGSAFSNNPLTSVSIGANVDVGSGSFPGNFEGAYTTANNKAAGTYIYDSNHGGWVILTPEGFTFSNGAITGYKGSATVVVIPDTISGQPVTAIGSWVFSGKQLTSVSIPNSVTTIGICAFENNQLTSVSIGNSVNTIGDQAFFNNQLTSVSIPNSVTTIGNAAFRGGALLTSVTIGANVSVAGDPSPSFTGEFYTAYTNASRTAGTYISDNGSEWYKLASEGDFVFSNGTIYNYTGSATVVTIPGTINGQAITAIGDDAFYHKGLTSVTILSSITSIGNNAFFSNQLTSVTIPHSVTTIGARAFDYNKLTSVTIPNSVTSIGIRAFSNNQLTSVDIGYGVTTIGDAAFRENQLTSVNIPNSVTTIGDGAFTYNQLTSVTIPNSVTSIGDWVFASNQLTSVYIPASVTSIGNNAFRDNQLTSVTIPNSVTSIGGWAFSYNQLTSVNIGNKVESIGDCAFLYNQLTSVTIPGSVAFVEAYAFDENPLTSVTIGSGVTIVVGPGYPTFPGNFRTVYNDGGKLAGTYKRASTSSTTWTKQ